MLLLVSLVAVSAATRLLVLPEGDPVDPMNGCPMGSVPPELEQLGNLCYDDIVVAVHAAGDGDEVVLLGDEYEILYSSIPPDADAFFLLEHAITWRGYDGETVIKFEDDISEGEHIFFVLERYAVLIASSGVTIESIDFQTNTLQGTIAFSDTPRLCEEEYDSDPRFPLDSDLDDDDSEDDDEDSDDDDDDSDDDDDDDDDEDDDDEGGGGFGNLFSTDLSLPNLPEDEGDDDEDDDDDSDDDDDEDDESDEEVEEGGFGNLFSTDLSLAIIGNGPATTEPTLEPTEAPGSGILKSSSNLFGPDDDDGGTKVASSVETNSLFPEEEEKQAVLLFPKKALPSSAPKTSHIRPVHAKPIYHPWDDPTLKTIPIEKAHAGTQMYTPKNAFASAGAVVTPPRKGTKPAQTKPVRTKPVRTRPVRTRPVRTRPVQTKPVQTKPDPRIHYKTQGPTKNPYVDVLGAVAAHPKAVVHKRPTVYKDGKAHYTPKNAFAKRNEIPGGTISDVVISGSRFSGQVADGYIVFLGSGVFENILVTGNCFDLHFGNAHVVWRMTGHSKDLANLDFAENNWGRMGPGFFLDESEPEFDAETLQSVAKLPFEVGSCHPEVVSAQLEKRSLRSLPAPLAGRRARKRSAGQDWTGNPGCGFKSYVDVESKKCTDCLGDSDFVSQDGLFCQQCDSSQSASLDFPIQEASHVSVKRWITDFGSEKCFAVLQDAARGRLLLYNTGDNKFEKLEGHTHDKVNKHRQYLKNQKVAAVPRKRTNHRGKVTADNVNAFFSQPSKTKRTNPLSVNSIPLLEKTGNDVYDPFLVQKHSPSPTSYHSSSYTILWVFLVIAIIAMIALAIFCCCSVDYWQPTHPPFAYGQSYPGYGPRYAGGGPNYSNYGGDQTVSYGPPPPKETYF